MVGNTNGTGAVGPKNGMWKGGAASYRALHYWINRHHPRIGVCDGCKAEVGTARFTGTEYANVSGEYLRDPGDYRELCRSCHTKFDQRGFCAKLV